MGVQGHVLKVLHRGEAVHEVANVVQVLLMEIFVTAKEKSDNQTCIADVVVGLMTWMYNKEMEGGHETMLIMEALISLKGRFLFTRLFFSNSVDVWFLI